MANTNPSPQPLDEIEQLENAARERDEDVFREEWEYVHARRRSAGLKEGTNDSKAGDGSNQPEAMVGLALSGGGLRSAMFNFGFLQALARRGVMRHVDFLSAVSGGSYTASHVTALAHRWQQRKDNPSSDHPVQRVDFHDDLADQLGYDADDKQTPRYRFANAGGYLSRIGSFFSRYFRDMLASMALFLGLVGCVATLLALLWRSFDDREYRESILTAVGLEFWGREVIIAFLPTIYMATLWLVAVVVGLIFGMIGRAVRGRRDATDRPQGGAWRAAHRVYAALVVILFVLTLCSVAVSVMVLIGNAEMGFLSKGQQDTWQQSLQWPLYLLTALSSLPLLDYRRVFGSAGTGASWHKRMIFRFVTYGTCLLLPLLVLSFMARENISGFASSRGPSLLVDEVFDYPKLTAVLNELHDPRIPRVWTAASKPLFHFDNSAANGSHAARPMRELDSDVRNAMHRQWRIAAADATASEDVDAHASWARRERSGFMLTVWRWLPSRMGLSEKHNTYMDEWRKRREQRQQFLDKVNRHLGDAALSHALADVVRHRSDEDYSKSTKKPGSTGTKPDSADAWILEQAAQMEAKPETAREAEALRGLWRGARQPVQVQQAARLDGLPPQTLVKLDHWTPQDRADLNRTLMSALYPTLFRDRRMVSTFYVAQPDQQARTGWLVGWLVLLGVGVLLMDFNRLTPFYTFYEERIRDTFVGSAEPEFAAAPPAHAANQQIPDESGDMEFAAAPSAHAANQQIPDESGDMPLHRLQGDGDSPLRRAGAPWPIIVASAMQPDIRDGELRPAYERFVFTPSVYGAGWCGYGSTDDATATDDGRQFSLATASALSGSAIHPSVIRNTLLTLAMTALGIRSGQWLKRPVPEASNASGTTPKAAAAAERRGDRSVAWIDGILGGARVFAWLVLAGICVSASLAWGAESVVRSCVELVMGTTVTLPAFGTAIFLGFALIHFYPVVSVVAISAIAWILVAAGEAVRKAVPASGREGGEGTSGAWLAFERILALALVVCLLVLGMPVGMLAWAGVAVLAILVLATFAQRSGRTVGSWVMLRELVLPFLAYHVRSLTDSSDSLDDRRCNARHRDRGWDRTLVVDGGFRDFMGVEELVLRRCKLVVVTDSACSNGANQMGTLAELERLLRQRHGIQLYDLDNDIPVRTERLRRDGEGYAPQSCLAVRIRYPATPSENDSSPGEATWGHLFYVQMALTGTETSDLEHFRRLHPHFPNEPTHNQFYSPEQVEAFRRLGEHVGESLVSHLPALPALPPRLVRHGDRGLVAEVRSHRNRVAGLRDRLIAGYIAECCRETIVATDDVRPASTVLSDADLLRLVRRIAADPRMPFDGRVHGVLARCERMLWSLSHDPLLFNGEEQWKPWEPWRANAETAMSLCKHAWLAHRRLHDDHGRTPADRFVPGGRTRLTYAAVVFLYHETVAAALLRNGLTDRSTAAEAWFTVVVDFCERAASSFRGSKRTVWELQGTLVAEVVAATGWLVDRPQQVGPAEVTGRSGLGGPYAGYVRSRFRHELTDALARHDGDPDVLLPIFHRHWTVGERRLPAQTDGQSAQ